MIYGGYPEAVLAASPDEKRDLLRQLVADYLLRDIFAQVNVNQQGLHDLLRLIAFQIGSEVSLHELSNRLGLDVKTVDRYLGFLEDAFVIRRLGGFSRNLRKEVGKSRKIYFLDLGIRNAVLDTFAPPGQREDIGRLWENYCFIERLKRLNHDEEQARHWFWRTYDRQEIDLIEEGGDGKRLRAFEFKWNPSKRRQKLPKLFFETYPHAEGVVVTPNNAADFLIR